MSGRTANMIRVMLMGRETYRVTADQRGLRVRSGRAWITLNGRDVVLKRGEEIALPAKRDSVVVSAAGRAPVVIELLGKAPRQSDVNLRPAVTAL